MLRAILLTAPFVLSVVISCGDSTPVFDDAPGSAGTDSSQSGASGNTSSQAGSMNAAGSNNNTAGSSNGGSSNTGGSGNAAGNGNTGGKGNTAGTGNNAGNGGSSGGGSNNGGTASSDGGAPAAGAPTEPMAGAPGAAGDTGVAGAPNGPLCPDIFGSYEIKDAQGNCDGFGKNAPQLIQGTDVACFAHFVSVVVGGPGNGAVNGGAALDQDGNFTGVKLYFGKTERSPCMGTWNQVEESMTVKCGGAADACTVVLDRK